MNRPILPADEAALLEQQTGTTLRALKPDDRPRRVIIESPYAGAVTRNVRYARAAMRDSIMRNEAPMASHLLYTQEGVLDDSNPEERKLGMRAGFAWIPAADATVVYKDLGISPGMRAGVTMARNAGRPVEFRSLPDWATNVRTPPPRRVPGHEGPGSPEGPRGGARGARGAGMPIARAAKGAR
jgi:hypothetical protein